MLEQLCKQLGLRFCGEQEDCGAFFFQIVNNNMVSCGASFAVFEVNKNELVFAMNQTEMRWINSNHKKEVNNHA
jgi:hypothetical protein